MVKFGGDSVRRMRTVSWLSSALRKTSLSLRWYGSQPIGGYASEAQRPKLFIPGPIEFSPEVLAAAGAGSRGHTDTTLIEDFGKSIELLRKVFITKKAQPFILSGSGALGWDVVACNFFRKNEKALVVHSGFFSERFAHCFQQYGISTTVVRAPKPGDRPSNEEVRKALKQAKSNGEPFKVVTITGVDTSTAVLADLQNLCQTIKTESPESLIVVDGVCSAGAEELWMDDWGIDFVHTGSQKALGTPPGLSIMLCSERAMEALLPLEQIPNYFANLRRWLPIMKAYEMRQPSYFATPAVGLVGALRVSLEQILDTPGGIQGYFKAHQDMRVKIHERLRAAGLSLINSDPTAACNLLTCIMYPKGAGAPSVLPPMKERGWILAAGLHPDCAPLYFRLGHMGYSVVKKPEYLTKLLDDLDDVTRKLKA